MSEKPRVYQGVRVKITVKDMLLQHRARQASSKRHKTVHSELKDLCVSTFQSRHVDPSPAVSPPVDVSSCGSQAPCTTALAAFPLQDGPWNLQMPVSTFSSVHQHQQHHQYQQHHQLQQHFGDVVLPSNGYSSAARVTVDYSAPLPPLPPLPASSPLPWCHAVSSDADYYGHGMAACSSSESLTLCNPPDHNSYSPQDSFSSSSSSCYDSPTRMNCSYSSFPSEHYSYRHCDPREQCWPDQPEGMAPSECNPFYSPTDYPYACPVEESYFRKDLPLSSEVCYNVL
ncbi:colorectal cancer associated 2 [Cololabis saira]|uniref:colorectal cancer associated 2 n=1 Tax=Cololabis saira TaxID=129043 RepID=UPI002AD1F5ED|nr:colorectal cancer associated 2 [Cololabis saira]